MGCRFLCTTKTDRGRKPLKLAVRFLKSLMTFQSLVKHLEKLLLLSGQDGRLRCFGAFVASALRTLQLMLNAVFSAKAYPLEDFFKNTLDHTCTWANHCILGQCSGRNMLRHTRGPRAQISRTWIRTPPTITWSACPKGTSVHWSG